MRLDPIVTKTSLGSIGDSIDELPWTPPRTATQKRRDLEGTAAGVTLAELLSLASELLVVVGGIVLAAALVATVTSGLLLLK